LQAAYDALSRRSSSSTSLMKAWLDWGVRAKTGSAILDQGNKNETMGERIGEAARAYAEDVRTRRFPGPEQIYAPPMPMVGQAICLVISMAMGSTTPSITTEKAPASATATASAMICDGQVLVGEDMLGLFDRTARFVRRYETMGERIGEFWIKATRSRDL
jgi:ketopantoate hydroxymethyltransferase